MSTFVDFSVTLPELPMVDLEGRCEVTVKRDGDEWAVTIEAVEVEVERQRAVSRYDSLPDSPAGNALDAAIRARLERDRNWIDSAAQKARSVA